MNAIIERNDTPRHHPARDTVVAGVSARTAPEYDHVLVPVDGSDRSLTAMPTARALARAFGAELRTVEVVRDAGAGRTVANDTASGAVLHTDADAGSAIAAHAGDLGATLICTSTRARTKMGRAVCGSTATSLMVKAAPLVVVGPNAERPGWSPPPMSWPAPLSSDRVVAFVDGTGPSEESIPWAAAWARALDKRLTLLTIEEDAPRPVTRTLVDGRFAPFDSAADYMDALLGQWADAAESVEGRVQRDPLGPGSGIRSYLARNESALVVLPNSIRTGFDRSWRRTDAPGIIRASTVPCLVVPGREPPRKFDYRDWRRRHPLEIAS